MSKEFELFKKRITHRGNTRADQMERDKLDSFKTALTMAYNSEEFEKDGAVTRGLISDNRLSLDYDEKILSVLHDAEYKVGDIILWKRTNTRWLVITEHLTERAYFKCGVKKALYKFKWRDDNGIVRETWAAIRGPVETKIVQEPKKHLIFDTPNNTMTLWFGASEGTEALRRYGKIMIAGKVWRINVVDDITTPRLIEMQLVEDYADEDRDNKKEQIARDYDHMIMEVEEPSTYTITGTKKVTPLSLTHKFTINPFELDGRWMIDPQFGSIVSNSGAEATIKFTGLTGVTEITYLVNNTIVGRHKVKVASLLG